MIKYQYIDTLPASFPLVRYQTAHCYCYMGNNNININVILNFFYAFFRCKIQMREIYFEQNLRKVYIFLPKCYVVHIKCYGCWQQTEDWKASVRRLCKAIQTSTAGLSCVSYY